MLPVLIPILGFAIQHAPDLISLLAGQNAGAVASNVVKTVKDVLGTTDPAEAQAKLDADPSLKDALAARLQSAVDQAKAEFEDTENARTMAIAFQSSKMAWIQIVGAVLIALLTAVVFAAVALHSLPDNSLIVGAALTWCSTLVAFLFGSSRGSQAKDFYLANSAPAAAVAAKPAPGLVKRLASSVRRG